MEEVQKEKTKVYPLVNNYIRANSLFSWRIFRAIAYKDEMRAAMEKRGRKGMKS